MELPYQSFWGGMTNLLLLNYQDMNIDSTKSSIIDLTYYVTKSLIQGNHSQEEEQSVDDLLQLDLQILPQRKQN